MLRDCREDTENEKMLPKLRQLLMNNSGHRNPPLRKISFRDFCFIFMLENTCMFCRFRATKRKNNSLNVILFCVYLQYHFHNCLAQDKMNVLGHCFKTLFNITVKFTSWTPGEVSFFSLPRRKQNEQ